MSLYLLRRLDVSLFFWLNPVTRTNATPNSMLRRLNRLSKIFPSGYGYCVQAKQA